MLVDSVYICINLQRRLKVATRKLTDKQKDKLKNSKYVRSNSDDVPWEFISPKNYYNYIYGPNHDEDDESVADLYED